MTPLVDALEDTLVTIALHCFRDAREAETVRDAKAAHAFKETGDRCLELARKLNQLGYGKRADQVRARRG